MSSRVLGPVRRSRDECPCHPSVPVVMHDDGPILVSVEGYRNGLRVECVMGMCEIGSFTLDGATFSCELDEPPEITEARANLPAHRPTDRDHFKINGGDHASV